MIAVSLQIVLTLLPPLELELSVPHLRKLALKLPLTPVKNPLVALLPLNYLLALLEIVMILVMIRDGSLELSLILQAKSVQLQLFLKQLILVKLVVHSVVDQQENVEDFLMPMEMLVVVASLKIQPMKLASKAV